MKPDFEEAKPFVRKAAASQAQEKQRNRRKITEGTEWDLDRETEFPRN